MHQSIRMEAPCELLNITRYSPLISKCQIKVCYVGEEPNRNGSVITKEVATEMANSLPGSPIVGYYNESSEDFEGHNREIDISDGQFRIVDTTRPYGFVDLNAKVWFQKFLDDGVEHEYLMTEGWLWTEQYPECKRILENGNNQSMELDEETLKASWAKIENSEYEFFIINEAIISKLCILGEDVEPCFEGASVTKVQFSFDENFENKLFSMMNDVKQILNEGGSKMEDTEILEVETQETETTIEEPIVEEQVEVVEEVIEESEETTEEVEPEVEFEKKDDEEEDEEEKCPECGKPLDECACEKNEDKKDKYNLNEIPEYIELKNNFDELTSKFEALQKSANEAAEELSVLKEYKAQIERENKQKLIDEFDMLSEEDKEDVVKNIDTYSLDDIEAKLSVICVRNNKINFSKNTETEPTVYSMNGLQDDGAPAWVKAVRETQNNLN